MSIDNNPRLFRCLLIITILFGWWGVSLPVVEAVSYGVHQDGEWEEGEQITGRVTTFGNIVVTKIMDNGSPALAHACAMKTQFDDAVLTLVAGRNPYLEVTLEKVIVTNVAVDYKSGDTRPTETVGLSYRKATWRYGTATTSYNIEAGVGGGKIKQRRFQPPRKGTRMPPRQPPRRR